MYKKRVESFNELPKDKRPPRYMWDRAHELGEFLEHVWDTDKKNTKENVFYEYSPEDVE